MIPLSKNDLYWQSATTMPNSSMDTSSILKSRRVSCKRKYTFEGSNKGKTPYRRKIFGRKTVNFTTPRRKT